MNPLVIQALREVRPRRFTRNLFIRSSIRILVAKEFSYRQIAAWLTVRGYKVDHNFVYRMVVKDRDEKKKAIPA